jgi:hypothetical protein
MTQNVMTSALEASGPKKYFFAFSTLLDGLAYISAIFLLKMQKKSKIGSPYYTWSYIYIWGNYLALSLSYVHTATPYGELVAPPILLSSKKLWGDEIFSIPTPGPAFHSRLAL